MLELGIQTTTTFLAGLTAASATIRGDDATSIFYSTSYNNAATTAGETEEATNNNTAVDNNGLNNWSNNYNYNSNYYYNYSSTNYATLNMNAASDLVSLSAGSASAAVAAAAAASYCNQSALTLLYNSSSVAGISNIDCPNHNTTNTTKLTDDISFILPWWRQVLWSVLFGGMVIVATGGNLIVVWIVMTTKRMRTVTNYFIVNLSIADAMVSSLNVTFNYIYMLNNDWKFGEFYCKLSQFIAMLSISASVFTLMAISIDRYVAIMKPLKPRMSKRSNLAIAAGIWLISTLISCPMLLFFTTEVVHTHDGGERTACYSNWPDGQTTDSTQEFIYNILVLILTYFLPIISMTVTYSRVGIELWGSKAIGEYTPRQVENVRSKRRVVKMMIVVVLIFAVCWLPFHSYFILTSCYPSIIASPYIQEAYLAIYWLAMSNSMYNPIIYCWMNSRFRFGFKMFFRWCPFVHIGAESLSRRDNMTSRYSCSGSPDHNRIKRNDTQKSILYACPSSPKSRRISHCGVLRNASAHVSRDVMRHSAPFPDLGVLRPKVTYQLQQQQQQQQSGNAHELHGFDIPKSAMLQRQKWTTSLSLTSTSTEQQQQLQQLQQLQQNEATSCSPNDSQQTTNLMS